MSLVRGKVAVTDVTLLKVGGHIGYQMSVSGTYRSAVGRMP